MAYDGFMSRRTLIRKELPLLLIIILLLISFLPILQGFLYPPPQIQVFQEWEDRWLSLSSGETQDISRQVGEALEDPGFTDLFSFSPSLKSAFYDLYAVLEGEDPYDPEGIRRITAQFHRGEKLLREMNGRRQKAYISLLFFALVLASLFIFLYYYQRLRNRQLLWEGQLYLREKQLILKTQEKERSSLARDLHDGAAQELAFARMAVDKLPPGPSKEVLKKTLSGSIQEIRFICHKYHPWETSGRGLNDQLRTMGRFYENRYGCTILFDLSNDEVDLGEKKGDIHHLQRIVQEALLNGIKHSGSRTFWVSLAYEDSFLSLFIRDEGVGLTEEPVGMGSQGMRERAELLGGKLCWFRPPAGGTVVQFKKEIWDETYLGR